MFVDSHCHIDFAPAPERAGIVERAGAAGVGLMLNVAASPGSFDAVLKVAEENPSVFAAIGVHPHEAEAMADCMTEETLLARVRGGGKVIAVGETGLDYSRPDADRDRQKRSLLAHISVAREAGLPLVVHNRDSSGDMEEILSREMKRGAFKAVIHCFTGGERFGRAMLELGFPLSASGIITFRNSEELRRIFAGVPLDRLLIETDSPFLAPAPYRGRVNEPAFVVEVAKTLSEIKDVPLSEIERATEDNFRSYFGL
ncbi:MAG: TatD family hydrolase [Rickettsiales bacterium]|jgi:TatD DNase family protein|nr:TatD family hydrolase [Rickettsiales bacterium]